jgi:hypothetical protein
VDKCCLGCLQTTPWKANMMCETVCCIAMSDCVVAGVGVYMHRPAARG